MLDAGAAVASASLVGTRPLAAAAWKGHVAVAKLLIRRGADPYAADAAGRTPLSVAPSDALRAKLEEWRREHVAAGAPCTTAAPDCGCAACGAARACGAMCALRSCNMRHAEAAADAGASPSTAIHKLLRCGGCRIAAYCCKAHQAAHWQDHKAACAAAKKAAADKAGR
jgi:hypothetical protein